MLRVEPLLGTRAEASVVARLPEIAESAERAIIDEVGRLESVFTVFDPTSALHDLRRSGATEVAELLAVIALANEWHELSRGAFHPGAQPLIDLWDAAEAAQVLPSDDDLAQTAARLARQVSPMSMNLNGIAKGWIADQALSKTVDAVDISSGWLNLGGDVVHRGSGSVSVGIEDPRRPYDNALPLSTVELSNEALATSGTARRWWSIDGQRISKVFDPRTGQPVDHIASATVIAPNGATADVLATAALVLAPSETLEIVAEADAECLLIDNAGAIISSSDRFTQT